ncbi:hypothetical protein D3C86_1819160 [compost metagenome]
MEVPVVTFTIVPVPCVKPVTPYSTTKAEAAEVQLILAVPEVTPVATTALGSKHAGNAELTTSSMSNTN